MSDTHPRRRREATAAGAAAALAAGAYALAAAARGTLPGAGPAAAGVRDVAVPFRTHLWDLAHGTTPGDLLFNWNSGYGAPFLPDFFGYLANPFYWPTVLLPRSAGELSVLLTTLLGIAAAGALMTHALGRLHPGPARLRALLAVGYALCAWVLDEGVANPAWLWGPVSLPLLLLAADWCLHERRWATGALCVAAAWAGNLHTAAAATLAAGLVLLIRLAAGERAPARTAPALRTWARVLGRAVTMTAAGVLIAAPVLFVALRAAEDAQPALLSTVTGEPPGPLDRFAQLLPGAPGAPALPDVAVGMLGLLLVASLPFNARVRARERIAWCVLPALAGLALASRPDVLRWHGLVLPVAGPYRAGFVLSGLLVLAAWVCLSHRPRPPALLGGAGLVLLLAAVAHGRPALRAAGWPGTLAALAVATAALWALERLHARPRATALVTLALACAVFGGAVRSAYTAGGPAQAGGADRSAVGAAHRALRAADDWPRSRADPGPHAFTANDALLLGGQGGGYASEQVPAATAQALHDLGAGWSLAGRRTLSPEDPVGRALFGVGTHLDDGPAPDGFTPRHAPAPPLVTVHPVGPTDTASVWSRREALLGSAVYDVPALTPVGGPAPTPHGGSGWSVPATPPGSAGTVLAGTCTPGSTAYFHSLWFDGTVSGLGTTYRSAGSQPVTAVGVRLLGPVPADGRVEVVLRASATGPVPARPVGCLRPGALEAAVARLTAGGGAAVTTGGHSVSAVLPAGSTGTAVLSVPAVRGWTCSSGGPYAAPRPVLGLIGVPLEAGASRVSCSYRVPGLAAGTLVGLVAAGVVALVAAGRWYRRRATGGRATGRAAVAGDESAGPATGGDEKAGPAPAA
ncbi:YfhO family protein [Kitasatospora sp. NPDC057015]|uniref:YfhO family protein n=1 Tax=Kitasatospora sp. NPDC057015 TaxID=3346001 RepID=UPI003634B138